MMITYLLQVTLCLAIFYAFYHIALRKETMFDTNRAYLMTTLVVSLVLPLVKISIDEYMAGRDVVLAPSVYVGSYVHSFSANLSEPAPASIPWGKVLAGVYLAGVAVMSIRLFLALQQILNIRKAGNQVIIAGHTCIVSSEVRSPFSFFNTIYLPQHHTFQDAELNEVIAHELAHVKGGHTWDVIFMELLCIKLWPSPMIYLYRKSLKEVHEYVADAAVLKDTPWENYAQLLVSQQHNDLQNILSNQLIYSQLKKRLVMMNKERSGTWARYKYLGIIPVLLLALVFFSFREKPSDALQMNANAETAMSNEELILYVTASQRYFLGPKEITREEIKPALSDAVMGMDDPYVKLLIDRNVTVGELSEFLDIAYKLNIRMVLDTAETYDFYKSGLKITHFLPSDQFNGGISKENMLQYGYERELPIFPGCELVAFADQGMCGMTKLGEYINTHLVYPESLKKIGKEGRVVARFIVGADGYVSEDISISESLHPDADQAVLQLIQQMNATVGRWMPAMKANKSCDAEVHLPVKFALNSTIEKTEEPYAYVEELPRFPGCEHIADIDERSACATGKLYEFINTNIKYPQTDKDKGIEGMCIVQFTIGVDGGISDIDVLRSPSDGMKNEAFRIMHAMADMSNKWIPARDKGVVVPMRFTLPIKFKLTEDAPLSEKAALGPVVKENEPYSYTEELPRFPGCEHISDPAERTACANRLMYEFINSNITYPKSDKDNKVEGMGIVQFVIGADGTISDIEVKRTPSPTIAEEMVRIVKAMDALPEKWIPARQDGKAVSIRWTVPFKFKLEDDISQHNADKSEQEQKVHIVPNPAKESILVSTFEGTHTLKIFDSSGNIVLTQKVTSKLAGNETIDIAGLKSGIYILQVISASQTLSETFSVVK